jgi:hypothetical protein
VIRSTCFIVALLFGAQALPNDSVPADGPFQDVLNDFNPRSATRARVAEVLKTLPDDSSDLSYRGLINQARQVAAEVRQLEAGMVKQRELAAAEVAARLWLAGAQYDDEDNLRSRDGTEYVQVRTLERFRETVGQLRKAAPASRDDPIRWLIVSRAAALLGQSYPSRARLAPLPIEAGKHLSALQGELLSLMKELHADGLALREGAIARHTPEARKEREASREWAAEMSALWQALAARRQELLTSDECLVQQCRKWLEEGRTFHRPRPIAVVPVEKEEGAPIFPVPDIRQLVPWQFVLAEMLGLGQLTAAYDYVGSQPELKDPAGMKIFPRIGIRVEFAMTRPEGVVLPVYRGTFQGAMTDLNVLAEEAYRDELRKILVPHKLPQLADLKDLNTLTAELQKHKVNVDLSKLQRKNGEQMRGALAVRLGRNPETYRLAELTWGSDRLAKDWFWLLHAPTTSGTGSRLEAAPKADAAASHMTDLIRERFRSALKKVEDNLGDELPGSEVLGKRYRKARQAADKYVESLGAAGVRKPNAGIDVKAIVNRWLSQGTRVTTLEVWVALTGQGGDWFSPPSTLGSLPPLSPPQWLSPVLDVLNDAERRIDRAVPAETELGWNHFLDTLARLEETGTALFGEGFPEQNGPRESLSRRTGGAAIMAGAYHLRAATGAGGKVDGERHFLEINAEVERLERELAKDRDLADEIHYGRLELFWLNAALALAAPERQDFRVTYLKHCVQRSPTPDTFTMEWILKAAEAPIPEAERKILVPRVERRKTLLVGGLKTREKGLAAELAGSLAKIGQTLKRLKALTKWRYPEGTVDLPIMHRLLAVRDGHRELRGFVEGGPAELKSLTEGTPIKDIDGLRKELEKDWRGEHADLFTHLERLYRSDPDRKGRASKRYAGYEAAERAFLEQDVQAAIADYLERAWGFQERGLDRRAAWQAALANQLAEKDSSPDAADELFGLFHKNLPAGLFSPFGRLFFANLFSKIPPKEEP